MKWMKGKASWRKKSKFNSDSGGVNIFEK